MFNQLTPFYRKLISVAVAVASLTVVFLFVLNPARVEGSSQAAGRGPDAGDMGERADDETPESRSARQRSGEDAAKDADNRADNRSGPESAGTGCSRGNERFGTTKSGTGTRGCAAGGDGGSGASETRDPHRLGVGDRVLVGSLVDKRTGRLLEDVAFDVDAFRREDAETPFPAVLSASQGKFVLSGLSAGEYEVLVRADGFAPLRTRVAIPAAEVFRFELDAPGRVRIRVTDPYARRLEPERIRRIDDEGRHPEGGLPCSFENGYHVVTGLDEGVQSLEIEVPGFAPRRLETLVDLEEPRSYWVIVE